MYISAENPLSVAFIITSASLVITLLCVIVIYWVRWRQKSVQILQILMILLMNEALQSGCEMLSYTKEMGGVVCMISLIGRVAFTVGANFWIIFITKMVYRQKLSPGKHFSLPTFMLRNIVLAYIPSMIISVFLLLVLSLTQSINQENCWANITSPQPLDYIIYGACFILPSFTSFTATVVYLILYYRLPHPKWTIYLLFPFTSILFSVYYIGMKSYVFFFYHGRNVALEIPLIVQSFIYEVLFLYIYCKQKKKKTDSEISLSDCDSRSFLDSM